MSELIIGKTYSMMDNKNNEKFVFKILNKYIYSNKLYYVAQDLIGYVFTLDMSLYKVIEEIRFTETNNHKNDQNQLTEDKIKDIKLAICLYMDKEIENLEKGKNNG